MVQSSHSMPMLRVGHRSGSMGMTSGKDRRPMPRLPTPAQSPVAPIPELRGWELPSMERDSMTPKRRDPMMISVGDLKRVLRRQKSDIHSDVLLAQVVSPKSKLDPLLRKKERQEKRHRDADRDRGLNRGERQRLPNTVAVEEPEAVQRTPATPLKLPPTPQPNPRDRALNLARRMSGARADEMDVSSPVAHSVTGPPGKEGMNCDLPEPSKWRRGALIPSVDDCLDRLYTELVPAEDVTRMRVMFSRFAKSGFELSKDDLPEVLRHLHFFLVAADKCHQIAKETTSFDVMDFNDFQDFYERFASYERQALQMKLKRWRPVPPSKFAPPPTEHEKEMQALQHLRSLLRSFGVVCTHSTLVDIRDTAGLKQSQCDNVTALTRFLAAFRASEGFTVNEAELLLKSFEECESDLVNLGPEGRMIKVSELAKGLLNFGGLYCVDHLHALMAQLEGVFKERGHGICIFEFLVHARVLRQMELKEVADHFAALDLDKDGFIRGSDLQALMQPLGFTLLGKELQELQAAKSIVAETKLDFDGALGFVAHVRQRHGFTDAETQECMTTFERFSLGSGEMPTLQVMELLQWMGFKNRVEDVRKMVQQVDFNANGTMDRTEYLRLMRLQKESKLASYRKVYQAMSLGKSALTAELFAQALADVQLHAPPRILDDIFGKLQAEASVSAGLSWETWVAVAEHTRKLIPVENRKQATFSDLELEQLRMAFNLQGFSSGYVSMGELLWMLSDSGMPVNKASGRRDLYVSLDKARKVALESGVPPEDVGRPGSPRVRFYPVVHLVRAFLRNQEQKTYEREEAVMRAVRFSSAEIQELRTLFEKEGKEAQRELWGDEEEATKRSLGSVVRMLCQEARVPINRVILFTSRIGARIKISQKEELYTKIREISAFDPGDVQRGIDFPSFLQLMQWMVDCNFGDINSAAERALNR
ncbi:Cabp1 [Symbiodinium necroappetens]|uniref:Calmodulin n=1 Tax=Symbiodinium necroappetens TaxID=1628268 RepID=A0A812TN46_9DINO|nr:Cabp1 [Symbiodinium necroappetens]